ncbi:MAG TPA: threonine/serine dehydratase [Pseudonocardiaceae bacterium]|nr:threonine/serine dehydratase [Pseudonocardiaceae bacterium]
MELVGIDDIRAAAKRIDGTVLRTALLPCEWSTSDRPLWIKPESFQAIGAFKVRGAANALAELSVAQRANGVVAYSSGNHAQAVAHAARAAGVSAVIVIDDTAPATKIAATRALGAEVVLVPLSQRQQVAEELASSRKAALIPPFDHPAVIAGQGTIGLEIAEDLPDVDLVLVPVSGGGLAAGVGVAIKALCPKTKVFAVEPELAGDTAASLAAGHRVHWPAEQRVRTIADGLRAEPSELTFAHLRAVLDGIVTVSEQEIRSAVSTLARRSGLVAEPAGAVTTAGYLYRQADLPAGKTVAVLSGRNIDRDLFVEILSE